MYQQVCAGEVGVHLEFDGTFLLLTPEDVMSITAGVVYWGTEDFPTRYRKGARFVAYADLYNTTEEYLEKVVGWHAGKMRQFEGFCNPAEMLADYVRYEAGGDDEEPPEGYEKLLPKLESLDPARRVLWPTPAHCEMIRRYPPATTEMSYYMLLLVELRKPSRAAQAVGTGEIGYCPIQIMFPTNGRVVGWVLERAGVKPMPEFIALVERELEAHRGIWRGSAGVRPAGAEP